MIILYNLLQVEMVGPEGNKIIWILLPVAIISIFSIIIWKHKKNKRPTFSRQIKVSIDKNKIYHPTNVHLTIQNNSSNAISIENPIIRFKRFRRKKAFKIKAVNTQIIYPLYLESGKTHSLPIALEPFYKFNKKLKRYAKVRVEFKFDKSKSKKSKYLLLKPTLFRKAKR